MALPPKKERKLTGRKAKRQDPYQAAHSLDDCVSATVCGLSVGREVGLDDAPKAAFGRLTSKAELGRPESDLDHVSSGFSTYLPSGKKREQRLRAQMVAQGYAPTAQDSDWDEPESQDPRAQSLAALYDAYGEDDAALEAAYDAYGAKEDDKEVASRPARRTSRKAERQAQTLRGLKTMGSLLAEPAVATVPAVSAEPEALVEEAPAEPERAVTPQVSFAEHDALEDEALRALLGPAYDAAVGAGTLLDSSAPKSAPPEPPSRNEDEALRDLLGPAYDAAVGAGTLLDSSAPKSAPSEAPEANEDEALRDLLGPAYDAAVGASTLLDSSAPKPAPPEAPESDEALRDLLGSAYDAAVGESTALASSTPKPAPSEAPEANEDEALRDLLGPAYDAAVGESTALASSTPKPAPTEAPEANEDEALRDLLGPAYDAAVGESTLLDSSAPKSAPPEAPSRNKDEALRDLLGPTYDAAVGASPALAPMPRSDTPEPQTARAPQAAPTSSLAQNLAVAASQPPELDAWVPPSPPEELSAADWVPPPLPDEAYASYDMPPWAGDEPPLPDEVPALAPAESWDAPWSHECEKPQTVAPAWSQVGASRGSSRRAGAIQARPLARGARGRTAPSQGTTPPRATPPRAMRAHGRSAAAAPEASVPYVKDLDEVSSSVGLHPYDPEALAGRRGRRGPEVKDLEGSASTVSMPYEQALSGYSVELDATGAGAAESAPRGKRCGSQYRRIRQAPSLEESASSVTLPLGAQSDELSEEPAATKRRNSRYSRRPQAAQVSSLDELSSSVTLPLGACPLEPDAPDTAVSAVDATVAAPAAGAQDAAGSDEVTLAYNEMIRLLTAREYSAYELTRKCTGRFAPAAVAAALARCQEQGFQSDERYADLLVRHMRLALYGSYKLRLEAQRKGVDWHLVEAALVKNELDWYELAYQCLRKKYSAADLSDYKTRVKANGFLGRRGFETAEREYALARLARGE